MKSAFQKFWKSDPLTQLLVVWVLNLMSACYVSVFHVQSSDRLRIVELAVFCFYVLLGPILAVGTWIRALHWVRQKDLELREFVRLYLAIILLFANFYFHLQWPLPGSIEGIHDLNGGSGREFPLISDLALTVVDCVHYSIVTITTLGFGDMRPTHWLTKIITDIELLSGMAVVVLGISKKIATKK